MRIRRKVPAAGRRVSDMVVVTPPGNFGRWAMPAELWSRLFRVALKRLEKADPHVAQVTFREYADLQRSWQVGMRDKSDSIRWAWMEEAFKVIDTNTASLSERGGFKTTGRRVTGPSNPWLLLEYKRMSEGRNGRKEVDKANGPRRKRSYPKTRNALELWLDVLDPPPSMRR